MTSLLSGLPWQSGGYLQGKYTYDVIIVKSAGDPYKDNTHMTSLLSRLP